MVECNFENIFNNFIRGGKIKEVNPFGSGHINDTFLVEFEDSLRVSHKYILQRLNTNVFKQPERVLGNIEKVVKHLEAKVILEGGNPNREITKFIKSSQNRLFYKDNENYWRVYPFVDGARSYDIVENPKHFYSAAKAFGKFLSRLNDFPADTLFESLPDFHNTKKRYLNFLEAVSANKAGRDNAVKSEIDFVMERAQKVSVLLDHLDNGELPIRVTHNDTKFNNVLIDDITGDGVCILDLDTVMPGLSLYDFGDAIRSGTNTGDEDDIDLNRVDVDLELFDVYTKGYLEEAGVILVEKEIELLHIAPQIMTLECGMRFLTDYLNGDIYFKISREHQNLDRCRTQFKMVKIMEINENKMRQIVENAAKAAK